MNTNRMSCGEVREKLPLYVGGDLDPDVLEAVRGHVELCAECARSLGKAAGARRVLVSAFRAQEGDVEQPNLWPGIRSKLLVEGLVRPEGEAATRTVAPTTRRTSWAWALPPRAAAAALALYLQLGDESSILPREQGPRPREIEVVDVPETIPTAGTLVSIPAQELIDRRIEVDVPTHRMQRGAGQTS